MASGFQNNQDQLTPNFYRVSINLSSGYSNTAANNDSGAIEAWDFTYFSTLNTTVNNSKRRARGNIRWNAILNQLQLTSLAQILDVTVLTGGVAQAVADDVAASVAFTVGYAQEEYVLGGWQQIINGTGGPGTFSDGSTTLAATDYDSLSDTNKATAIQNCIKEAITRGITIGGSSGYVRRYRTYDASLGQDYDQEITVTQPKAPSAAWANVTVSIIDTMTQQTF